ncbi:MAG: hypothetical protein RIT45_786 [Pseudomonadota bacterium]
MGHGRTDVGANKRVRACRWLVGLTVGLGSVAPAVAHHRSSAGRIDAFTASAGRAAADADANTLALTLGSSYGRYDRWLDPSGSTTSPGAIGRFVGEVGVRFDAGARGGLWLRMPVGGIRVVQPDAPERFSMGMGDLQLGGAFSVHRLLVLHFGVSLPTGSRAPSQSLQQTQWIEGGASPAARAPSQGAESVVFRTQTDASLGAGVPGFWLAASGRRPLSTAVQAQFEAGWRGFVGATADGWTWGRDWTARAALAWRSAGGGLGLRAGLAALLHRDDRAPGGARYGARREWALETGVDFAGPGSTRCAFTTRIPLGQWSEDALMLASVETALRCRVVVVSASPPRSATDGASSVGGRVARELALQ